MNTEQSPPNSDFVIPPTPARLGAVQRSNEICDLLNEEEYVDEGSLSTLTGEVLEAQRCQLSELDTKRSMLHDLENELKRSQQAYQIVLNEVKTMNRQLYLLQENVDGTKKDCCRLESDIIHILSEKRRLQSRFVDTLWNSKRHVISFEKYRKKMRKFQETVEDFRKGNTANVGLKQVQKEILDLKVAISNRCSEERRHVGSTCVELQSEIQHLKEKKSSMNDEIRILKLQEKKDKENLFILKKENDAFQKRDAAKLKRVKQQIFKCEQQNKDMKDENARLLKHLQDLEV